MEEILYCSMRVLGKARRRVALTHFHNHPGAVSTNEHGFDPQYAPSQNSQVLQLSVLVRVNMEMKIQITIFIFDISM